MDRRARDLYEAPNLRLSLRLNPALDPNGYKKSARLVVKAYRQAQNELTSPPSKRIAHVETFTESIEFFSRPRRVIFPRSLEKPSIPLQPHPPPPILIMRISPPLKNRKITKVLSASIIALAVSSGASFAADATWTGSASDVWTNGGPLNFTVGGVPSVFTSGDNAFFNDTATAFSVTPDLSTPPTPAAITVDNSTNDYTFNAGGALSGTTTSLTKRGTKALTIVGNNNTFRSGDEGIYIKNGAINVTSIGSADGTGQGIIVGSNNIPEAGIKPGALGEGRDMVFGSVGSGTAGTLNYNGPSDIVYRGIKSTGGGAFINVMNASTTLDLRYFQVDTNNITQTGPGTLIFHGGSFGNNGYKLVAANGTLLQNNPAANRTGGIGAEALNGGTFGGTGSMNSAAITIRTGGAFKPGIHGNATYLDDVDFEARASAGVGSVVVFETGSIMKLDLLNTASNMSSSTHLAIDISASSAKSTLQFNGTLTLELANPNNLTPLLTDKFFIVDGAVAGNYIGTALSGANVSIDLAKSGFAFANPGAAGNVVYDNNDIYITGVVAVPEPSTIATLLGGIGTLIGFRRLGRRKAS